MSDSYVTVPHRCLEENAETTVMCDYIIAGRHQDGDIRSNEFVNHLRRIEVQNIKE